MRDGSKRTAPIGYNELRVFTPSFARGDGAEREVELAQTVQTLTPGRAVDDHRRFPSYARQSAENAHRSVGNSSAFG
jgi:hypothetical protein